jgi:hypothetical protein
MHEFVNDLCARSSEFDAFWRRQDVLERDGGERRFHHPLRGNILYRQLTLRVANSPGLKLVMLF